MRIPEARKLLIERLLDQPMKTTKARRLKHSSMPRWLRQNLVGVAEGFKVKDGKVESSECLTIFVRTKYSLRQLGDYALYSPTSNPDGYLHDELNGVLTDVVECGPVRPVTARLPRMGRATRLSIGDDLVMAGRTTHGVVCAFVARGQGDDQPYGFISCGHVLDSHNKAFTLVVSGKEVVGRIDTQADLFPWDYSYRENGQQDVTLADFLNGVTPDPSLPGGLGWLSPAIEPPHCGMHVWKAGKTVTAGTVQWINASILVDYPAQTSLLHHQIVVSNAELGRQPLQQRSGRPVQFATPGDSGSLVVTKYRTKSGEEIRAVGMVVAAGDPYSLLARGRVIHRATIVTPMKLVLRSIRADALWIGGNR